MQDLNGLRTFVLAAETLNFTRVAELRHTVQSAVSAQIAKLEAELGRPLITRGRGKEMHLTAEGTAFLVYARRILELADEASQSVRRSHTRPVLRLGTTMTIALSVLPNVLSAFAAAQPQTQIHIQCDRSDALLARLDADEIDVAVMMDQGKHPGRAFVQSQPLAWVSAPGFALAEFGDVPLVFLTDGRDLRRYAFEALDRVGRHGHIAHLSPHPVGARAFVQSGLALTVMPISTVAAPLQVADSALELPALGTIALSGYQQSGQRNESADLLVQMLSRAVSWQSPATD